jgi:hypothetical protein
MGICARRRYNEQMGAADCAEMWLVAYKYPVVAVVGAWTGMVTVRVVSSIAWAS